VRTIKKVPDHLPDYTSVHKCRVCGGLDTTTPLFFLGEQFVSDFVPKDQVNKGIKCPIDLELCDHCGLVQNKYTARQDFLYTRHYWYRSGVTQTMKDQLQDVVDSAVRRVDSWGKDSKDIVLDIGSNDGTLLRCYPKHFLRVGVEPADNLATNENYRDHGLELVHDFWPSTHGEILPHDKAKIITACGMFYDLEDPNAFIKEVSRVLHPEGLFVAQLMCLKQTLENHDISNLAHEHLEFYSLKSLAHLFRTHGLEIFDVEENNTNGGSYRLFVRHADSNVPYMGGVAQHRKTNAFIQEHRMGLDRRETYTDWFRRAYDNRRKVVDFIRAEVRNGYRVHAYGASTKGNVILQWYDLNHTLIQMASDRSPEKWGKYTVGTGIPVVSEEESRYRIPDYYLVLPYAFLREFIEREKDWLQKGGKFIVPLPTPRLVYLNGGEIKEVVL